MPMHRRQFVGLSAATLFALSAGVRASLAQGAANLQFGPRQPFSFDWLRQQARERARSPYAAAHTPLADVVQSIDFDAIQKIQFRKQCALWRDGPGSFPVSFFHLNKFVGQPVDINVVQDGQARRILYSKGCFDYGDATLADSLPNDLGYSGFRLMDGRDNKTDWLAFQGASYFRSSGAQNQYGISARGIAVNSGLSTPEEFPMFTQFWLMQPQADDHAVTFFALLEGPSLTGAYRFEAAKQDNVVMTVHAELFTRADIERLGLAPLTSMYWYGKNSRASATDWRPEVHDSDGLALWTGKDERIWRPLINPPSVQTNSFFDVDPKGFGLMQRDHAFANYQDDGAFYNKRPSVWVEPIGSWGEGAVQLVEIPTDDEIHDNIVAYWTPKAPVTSGQARSLDYRLYWQDDEPHPPDNLARVMATRIGRGGVPGQPVPKDQWKFVIDFEGGPLASMEARYDIKPMITLSRGTIANPYVVKVVGTNTWRAFFDVAAGGSDMINMRCYLRLGDATLSETWLYQYFPTRVA
jgi:glucans biosynthesis protein